MFSKEVQLEAIKMYLSGVPTGQMRKKFNIRGSATILNWVTNIEYFGLASVKDAKRAMEEGSLKPRKQGRTTMSKSEDDRIKELEKENFRLQIELAYLKNGSLGTAKESLESIIEFIVRHRKYV